MKRLVPCIVLALATVAFSQTLSVNISPNPAAPGQTIVVTAQSLVPNEYTPFGCLLTSVSSGMPGGPNVGLFPCTFLPGAIPVCGSTSYRTGQWTPSLSQAPGQYWFQIQHHQNQFGGPAISEWFCVTLHDPVNNPAPALSALNMPTWGNAFQMSLSAPTAPFANYGVALSATTNVGIPYAGGHAALDLDDVFAFSLTQDPAFFINFSGQLDAGGMSPTIWLLIPPIAGITCVPLHAQAVVFTGSPFTLSNDLSFTIK
jgi:hypothetical protein